MNPFHRIMDMGGDRPVYLMHDFFMTPVAAPLAASRSSEPGPGLMKKATDTANLGSIAGGEVVLVGKNSFSDPQYYWTQNDGSAFPRVQGRAFIGRFRTDANATAAFAGWTSSASAGNPDAAFLPSSGALIYREFVSGVSNYQVGFGSYSGALDVFFAVVMRSANADLFIYGGPYTQWSYLWRGVGGTAAYYPFIETNTNTGIAYLSQARVVDMPAPFNTDAGIYSLNVASPTDATNVTGDADGLIELTVVAPGVLTGPMELNFRYTDDNNRWVAYFDNTGAFKADSIVSGSRTNRVNAAGVATVGNTYIIRVHSLGSKHNFYTGTANNFTRRGVEIDVATPMDTVSTIRPVLAANWTMSNLRSTPVQIGVYNTLGAT